MAMSARRRTPLAPFLAALAAVWVMALQAALPAPAMAASADQIVICTLQGSQTITLGDHAPAPPMDSAACRAHCLAATLTALNAAPPPSPTERVAYPWSAHVTPPALAPYLTHARPRPPGQGPPAASES
jgi:hypothetical protein